MKFASIAATIIALMLTCPQLAVAGDDDSPKSSNGLTKCGLTFSMKTWSVGYKSGKGQGTISCDNGQTAEVKLKLKGGGLTAGKGVIRDGKGSFSEVYDIADLFGGYVVAEASAGAGKSAGANVMTKGEVSLALSGTGSGVELGFSVGKFTIKKR